MVRIMGNADGRDRRPLAEHAQIVRQDISLTADTLRQKGNYLRSIVPMYVPALKPVGRSLSLVHAEHSPQLPVGCERTQILPRRQIATGEDDAIDAAPLYGWTISPGLLVTDARLFHGYLSSSAALIDDPSVDYRASRHEWSSFRRMQRFPTRRRLGGAVSLITGAGGATNYADWLYDVLPRVFLLREGNLIRENDPYLVPSIRHEFQRTTLDLLGISPSQCVEIDRPAMIEADRLVATAGHRNYGHIEPWLPQFLRSELMEAVPKTGRRLYVNRRDTRKRRIVNEESLEAALKSRGFDSVTMADHSFREKVHLFASADAVVAAHGAGLANIAFCAPEAAVVEIKGDNWDSPIIHDVARATGLRYTAVAAGRTVSTRLAPAIARQVEIDVELVLDAVDGMLK